MAAKVSVISTVYNGIEYFDRALPGIINQDFENFEYIIVDDGSNDGTWKELERWARRYEKIKIFNNGRLGRARALNYAVEQARGDFIANQDFDDVSYPNRLKMQAAYLNKNPRVGLVGSWVKIVDDIRKEEYLRKLPTSHERLVRSMAKYIPFPHTLVMYRKKCWNEIGGYPEVDDIEDLKAWCLMAEKGWKFSNVPEVLGEHWIHSSSFWHKNFKERKRQLKLAKVQREVVFTLNLPIWMYIYPFLRMGYTFLPKKLKILARQTLGNFEEYKK